MGDFNQYVSYLLAFQTLDIDIFLDLMSQRFMTMKYDNSNEI